MESPIGQSKDVGLQGKPQPHAVQGIHCDGSPHALYQDVAARSSGLGLERPEGPSRPLSRRISRGGGAGAARGPVHRQPATGRAGRIPRLFAFDPRRTRILLDSRGPHYDRRGRGGRSRGAGRHPPTANIAARFDGCGAGLHHTWHRRCPDAHPAPGAVQARRVGVRFQRHARAGGPGQGGGRYRRASRRADRAGPDRAQGDANRLVPVRIGSACATRAARQPSTNCRAIAWC